MMYSLLKIECWETMKKGLTVVRDGQEISTYSNPDFEYKKNFKRCFLFIIPLEKDDIVKSEMTMYYPNSENIYAVEEVWAIIRELCDYLKEEWNETPALFENLVHDQLMRILDYSKYKTYMEYERGRKAIMSIWNNVFAVMASCGETFSHYVHADVIDKLVSELISSYEFELLEMFFTSGNEHEYSEENRRAYNKLCKAKNSAITFFKQMSDKKGQNITVHDEKFSINVKISVI